MLRVPFLALRVLEYSARSPSKEPSVQSPEFQALVYRALRHPTVRCLAVLVHCRLTRCIDLGCVNSNLSSARLSANDVSLPMLAQQIVLPTPLGPNLPSSAKPRAAHSDGGFGGPGGSSLLRDPSKDKFYPASGGGKRGHSMYQGPQGWPGPVLAPLGTSLGDARGSRAQERLEKEADDHLLGSEMHKRHSVAPSITIQAPVSASDPDLPCAELR